MDDTNKIATAMAAVDKELSEATQAPRPRLAPVFRPADTQEPRNLPRWLQQLDGRLEKIDARLTRLERWLGTERE